MAFGARRPRRRGGSGILRSRLSAWRPMRFVERTCIAMPARWPALVPRVAVITRVPLRTILIPMPAALLRDRTLALAFLRRTLEAPQLLPQHFDIARVRGALALRFLNQFEHLIHLLERLAQRRDHFHHFVDGFANRVRRSGLKGTRRGRRQVPRRRALVPRRRRGRFAGFGNLTRGLVRHFHLRGRRKK